MNRWILGGEQSSSFNLSSSSLSFSLVVVLCFTKELFPYLYGYLVDGLVAGSIGNIASSYFMWMDKKHKSKWIHCITNKLASVNRLNSSFWGLRPFSLQGAEWFFWWFYFLLQENTHMIIGNFGLSVHYLLIIRSIRWLSNIRYFYIKLEHPMCLGLILADVFVQTKGTQPNLTLIKRTNSS